MRPLAPWVRPLPLLACLALAGCDDPLPAVGFVGPEACVDPALGTLEYFEETMVPELFAPYCLPCHSTDRSGSERHGAPSYLDFDDFESAKSVNAAVWARVAAREMPPMAATPSTEELELLVAWLDCTAPATGQARIVHAPVVTHRPAGASASGGAGLRPASRQSKTGATAYQAGAKREKSRLGADQR